MSHQRALLAAHAYYVSFFLPTCSGSPSCCNRVVIVIKPFGVCYYRVVLSSLLAFGNFKAGKC